MSDANLPAEPRRDDYTRTANPFGNGGTAMVPSGGAVAQAEQQRAIAEVQARMIIARANPRDPKVAMDLILNDCTRETLAAKALYSYARGGTDITGPSIRLAEALAQRWGNIASGFKELSRTGGHSEVVAYAWDLQTGFYDERQFQVRHWRDTKQGGRAVTDERDIYELIANAAQRRKRAVLLTVIPGDVVEAAVAECENTLNSTADTSPAAMQRMLDSFEGFGVTKDQIEKRIQRRIEAIRPAQVVQLRKIYTSLYDGMSNPEDWFEAEGGAPGNASVWGAVDQAHATATQQTAGTTGRRAPRKSPAKEATAKEPTAETERGAARIDPRPDADEMAAQGDTGQKPPTATATVGTQREAGSPAVSEARGDGPAAPLAASSQTSASAGETRTSQTGAAMGTSAPEKSPPNSSGAAFSAYLVDGDGIAIDGTDEFTDPIAFAKAYIKAFEEMFPPERKPFERANAEALAAAREASPYAVEEALNPPQQTQPESKASEASSSELPLNAPHDNAVIPKPAKPTRAAFAAFNEALKAKVATATDLQLGHIQAVNTETINAMPNAFRLEAVGIIEARRKELAGPARTNGAVAPDIVEDLRKDVLALESADAIRTWLNMPRIKTMLASVQATDLSGWSRVMATANGAYVRKRVEDCDTLERFQALDGEPAVEGAIAWLQQNDAAEYDAIIDFIKQHRAGFPG